eukprot:SAG31_NODE_41837_length_274_cov_0.594286_1_plen_67_part_01
MYLPVIAIDTVASVDLARHESKTMSNNKTDGVQSCCVVNGGGLRRVCCAAAYSAAGRHHHAARRWAG